MRSRLGSLSLALVLCLGSAAAPATAAAPSPVAEQQAAAKFRAGLERFDAGAFEQALPLFQEAWSLTQSPNARLYIARCLVELGRDVQAHAEFSGVVTDTTAKRDPRYDRTREAAQAELSVVGLRVSKLVITLPDSPAGLVVSLDGEPIPAEQLGVPIVATPGRHEVVARAAGMADVARSVDVAAGQSKTVMLALSPARRDEAAAPTPSPSPGLGAVRTAGLVTAGVGVAALGVFTVTGLMAKSQHDSVTDACGGTRCTDDKYGADIDRGKSLQTVANVSLLVGGLAVLTGASLFVWGSRGENQRAATAIVLPGGGYASYRASF